MPKSRARDETPVNHKVKFCVSDMLQLVGSEERVNDDRQAKACRTSRRIGGLEALLIDLQSFNF